MASLDWPDSELERLGIGRARRSTAGLLERDRQGIEVTAHTDGRNNFRRTAVPLGGRHAVEILSVLIDLEDGPSSRATEGTSGMWPDWRARQDSNLRPPA